MIPYVSPLAAILVEVALLLEQIILLLEALITHNTLRLPLRLLLVLVGMYLC